MGTLNLQHKLARLKTKEREGRGGERGGRGEGGEGRGRGEGGEGRKEEKGETVY